MKKFIVTFDVPGADEFRVLCVEAKDEATAVTNAAMALDDEGIAAWSLVSVDPVHASRAVFGKHEDRIRRLEASMPDAIKKAFGS